MDLIEVFWQARQQGVCFPPAWFGKLSVDQAYAVQLGLIERRCAAGERQIGWKVGLTAPAIQQQFGFHEPVWAEQPVNGGLRFRTIGDCRGGEPRLLGSHEIRQDH